MVNKEKALKRKLTYLRKTQNPQQVDFKRMRKLRSAKTAYWKLKKKAYKRDEGEEPVEKEKKKKTEEPELEVIDDTDIDDLYSYDEEIDDEELDE